MQKYLKSIIAFSIVFQIAFIKIIAQFPEFVEQFYSNGLYLFISKLMRYAFGWLPFSIGDILYTVATIYILRWLFVNRTRIIKDTKSWGLDVFCALSIGYFAFHLLWAFNYYRLPLHKTLQLQKEYSTEALIATTKMLITTSNAVHINITKNDTLKVEIPYTKQELLDKVPEGYAELSQEFPQLTYSPKSIKKSLYSLPLTYMGFSGYLNPFTNEAQIDGLIPSYKYPTTASHEVAHQLGFAAENEANFIGSMAAMHHKDLYFQYSGYTFALRHCLHDLYKRDPETYKVLIKTLHPGILKNYEEAQNFWNDYQNPIEPLFKTTYNSYLKANNQVGGINSYSYVVALLVNYTENNPPKKR